MYLCRKYVFWGWLGALLHMSEILPLAALLIGVVHTPNIPGAPSWILCYCMRIGKKWFWHWVVPVQECLSLTTMTVRCQGALMFLPDCPCHPSHLRTGSLT